MRTTPDSSKSLFAATEAEAVRFLRERGYIVAPPYPSASDPASITPPPPYALHPSSSQPVRSIARETETPATSICKRKREGDRTVVLATSCPPTPIQRPVAITVAQTLGASRKPEIGDSDADDDDDDDDDEVVSAPQRKKRSTTRTTRTSPPQKPTTPPRRKKTKKGTLTTTISYEAAAEITGAAQETVNPLPTEAGSDGDVSDGGERDRPTAGEKDRAMPLDDGE